MQSVPGDYANLRGRIITLDCRWLGLGGAGRVTELLLAELRDIEPTGAWLLWGDPNRLVSLTFPGSSVAPWHGHPTRWFGQADFLGVPRADVVVYLHQIRPLRSGPSVTVVHDTIPLRFERHRPARMLKKAFFEAACRLSTRIVTVSPWSRDSIVRDLGVRPSKIVTATLGVEPERGSRIRAIRERDKRVEQVLFVGRFAPHKNLERLCRAFQLTAFRRNGGRLLLVGGTDAETGALSVWVAGARIAGVDVRAACTEAELDELLATCRALVQPSLEEGYGLPAVEAAVVGVQVAVSRTGYAAEIPASLASFLDPLNEHSIAAAIDTAVARSDAATPWRPQSTLARDVLVAVASTLAKQRLELRGHAADR